MIDTVCKLRTGGPRSFFFIFDGEGEVMLYLNLAKRLSADFTVYGIMPQTKTNIPLANLKIEEIASASIKQIKNYQSEGPYFIGGLCAGGVIAFEMVVQLERARDSIGCLLLLEAVEPGATARRGLVTKHRFERFRNIFSKSAENNLSEKENVTNKKNTLNKAIAKLFSVSKYEVSSRFKAIYTSFKIKLLTWRMKKDGGWPSWIHPLDVSDIYSFARDNYSASNISASNVVLVKSRANVLGSHADEPLGNQFHEELLGWEPYVKTGLTVLSVDGGHSSMLQEPYVDDLALQLEALLVVQSN